ncbi:hypothetical protein VTO42DRAFT_4007 [Malbranchea cinnamomea]
MRAAGVSRGNGFASGMGAGKAQKLRVELPTPPAGEENERNGWCVIIREIQRVKTEIKSDVASKINIDLCNVYLISGSQILYDIKKIRNFISPME